MQVKCEVFLVSQARSTSLRGTARRGGGSHPLPRGTPGAETFLFELDSEDSLLFGGPLVGVGAPTPCRGALPERRLSFLGLSSKGSLRLVV